QVGSRWDRQGSSCGRAGAVLFSGSWGHPILNAEWFATLDSYNTAGVSAAAGATVDDALSFTAGRLATGANTVTVAAGGSVTGAGAGKYVYGKLKKHVAITGGNRSQSFEGRDAAPYAPVCAAATTGASAFPLTPPP